MRTPDDLGPYLDRIAVVLRDVDARVTALEPAGDAKAGTVLADARIAIRLRGQTVRLHVEVKRTHLATAVARALVATLGARAPEWILFAPYVGRPLGEFFAEHGLNYVDLAGNCFLRAGRNIAFRVEGRTPYTPTRRARGVRAAGVRALFALVADPTLLEATGRAIANAAQTVHPTALGAVRRLEDLGAIACEGRRRRWLPGGLRVALERWLDEYETVLRPALLVGTYRTPDRTPAELDARVAALAATDARVRFGGTAAADRIAPHHRGETTVVHVDGDAKRILARLRAAPDPRGTLVVMGMPGPLAAVGATPDTVHPLLVYAETLHAADDRALEAARALRAKALRKYA
ncbi:MAG: hypothetical protein JNM10_03015 [Planctomycetia bacterium]|nr:hypothetical protein [Planctomycetia bacterium]